MTNEQLAVALEKAQQVGRGRFACVGDISCDVEVRYPPTSLPVSVHLHLHSDPQGGLEFLPHASTLSSPFFSTRPPSLPAHLPSVTMMSVDILPTALPLESSEHFSKVLLPYLKTLIRSYRDDKSPIDSEAKKRADALERATIASSGKLRSDHQWLEKPLNFWKDSVRETSAASQSPGSTTTKGAPAGRPRKKKVLVLGSGMVAGPAIDEICRWGDVELVVGKCRLGIGDFTLLTCPYVSASNILSEAQRLTHAHVDATPLEVDVSDQTNVGSLIEKVDVVIRFGLHVFPVVDVTDLLVK